MFNGTPEKFFIILLGELQEARLSLPPDGILSHYEPRLEAALAPHQSEKKTNGKKRTQPEEQQRSGAGADPDTCSTSRLPFM